MSASWTSRARPARRPPIDLARRQAHAAVLLLQLEEWDNRRGPLDQSERIRADRLWPLLRDSPDPRLRTLRSYLIHRFARAGVKPDVLLERYAAEENASARRALLLSLGEFKDYQLPADSREAAGRASSTATIRTRASIPRWTGCCVSGSTRGVSRRSTGDWRRGRWRRTAGGT